MINMDFKIFQMNNLKSMINISLYLMRKMKSLMIQCYYMLLNRINLKINGLLLKKLLWIETKKKKLIIHHIGQNVRINIDFYKKFIIN